MKSKILFILLIPLLLLPSVQAMCMSQDEYNNVTEIAVQMNVSSWKFVNVFESMCERITDADLVLNRTLLEVDRHMANYTAELEERADVAESLAAIYKLIDAASNVTNMNERIQNEVMAYENRLDDRFTDIGNSIDMKMSVSDFEYWNATIRGAITNIVRLEMKEYAGDEDDFPLIYAVIAALVLVMGGVYGYKRWVTDARMRKAAKQTAAEMKASGVTQEDMIQSENKIMLDMQKEMTQNLEEAKAATTKRLAKQVIDVKKHVDKNAQDTKVSKASKKLR